MPISPRHRILIIAALGAAYACGPGATEEETSAAAAPGVASGPATAERNDGTNADGLGALAGPGNGAAYPGDAAAGSDEREAEPAARPREIYHDLTVYDWYRRGEPLVHDGEAYQPAGTPIPTPEGRLRRAGRYGGVDYYMPDADPDGTALLLVPVFEGYWLPFAPTSR